jgi:hypothetical protein
MEKFGQTAPTLYRDTHSSRTRKFSHDGSPLSTLHNIGERRTQETTLHKSKERNLPLELNSSSYMYQTLLIPDEECLAEAEVASFDIVGLREGFHLFGGEVSIIGVPTKIYLTTFRVSPLDPATVVNML